jgi:putative hemolysin
MELPSAGTIILKVLLVFILIFVNGFFSMSEIAIITLNDNKIEKMANDGNKKAKKIMKFTDNSSKFLSTIQIGVTLAGFLASAFAAESFVGYIMAALKISKGSSHYSLINTLILIAVTMIMSYFTLVLGELVPKKLGMQKAEKISFAIIGILNFFQVIFTPLVKILAVSANAVVRMLGLDPSADQEEVTEEEILMMVDVGEEKGVIEEAQSEMMKKMFEFDDMNASDLMVHRTDIVAVEINDSIKEVLKAATESGRSRIAVYEDDIDSIKGVVYAKDLLAYVGKSVPAGISIKKLIRPALFVPESKKADDIFKEMCESKIQIAIVVDEYGGTAGLVTLEDLIESIVGDIQDEYDNEEAECVKVDDGIYNFEGDCDIEDAEEGLGKIFPKGDYDTLAGFLLELIGDIPSVGDKIKYENLTFTITDMDDRRIEKIQVKVDPKEDKPDSGEEKKTEDK